MAASIPTELDKLAANLLARIPEVTDVIKANRRPVFIEFSGTPKAGKSSTLDRVERFLRHSGFRVSRIAEAAAQSPVTSKDYIWFNLWTSSITISRIVEELDRCTSHFVLIDRGVFDAFTWFEWMHRTGKMNDEERDVIWSYLSLGPLIKLTDLVVLMTADAETALKRERGGLATSGSGKIMNPLVLTQLSECVRHVHKLRGESFTKILPIDTTKDDDEAKVTEKVIVNALQSMDEFMDETLWVITRSDFESIGIRPGLTKETSRVEALRELLRTKAVRMKKAEAEANEQMVQVIPCGVIRHKDQVLLLKRRESDSRHRLNDKFVIWAGGHIREEDSRGAKSLDENCLERELFEELWFRTQFEYSPICCVLDTSSAKSAKHVGLVFDVKVQSDDVAAHLSEFKEFKEGKGRSVSGKFYQTGSIPTEHASGLERWSTLLLREYFNVHVSGIEEQPSLFENP